jgi:RNA polymerase sigma-70 factor (ECF subfamily)
MGASRTEIEELYRDRYLGFRRALAAVCGNYESAHDVVQEAFARALTQRTRFRGEAPLGAWVWTIAMRVALDERSKALRLPLEEGSRSELDESELSDAFAAGLVEPARDPELSEALRTLPPRRRVVFFLRYFADMSYQEIAAVCGISEGTVAASLAQARLAVAEALGEEVRS